MGKASPSSKPPSRQKRKRKIEMAEDTIQEKSYAVGKTQKRPCRRRRDNKEPTSHNNNSSIRAAANNNAGNQQQDKLNGSNSTNIILPTVRHAHDNQRSNDDTVMDNNTTPPSCSATRIKSTSIAQKLRRLADDNIDRNKKCDASRMKDTITLDDEHLHNGSTEKEDDGKQNQRISFTRERRKLQYMLISLVVFAIIIVGILSSIMHIQHFNHNMTILQEEAISSHAINEQTSVIDSKTNQIAKLQQLYEETQFFNNVQSDILHHNYFELANDFRSILIYTNSLQHSYEEQSNVISDLSAIVQQLRSSLATTREDLEVQRRDSILAVNAVSVASNELSIQKTQKYEMERVDYIDYMDIQLAQLEDEATSAVQAVATASGKLEYERKIEEEGRWRSYIEETEYILGGLIPDKAQDGHIHDISNADRLVNTDIIITEEPSVLKAAISRRIEDGITSLRSYIHPYNYLKQKEDKKGRMQTFERQGHIE